MSSLHPVYDDSSIVFDETLVGNWQNTESQITVTIARGEWRSYEIAYTDRFGTKAFDGHLTAVGTARFLNVLPDQGLEKPPFIVATNGFMQVEVANDRVRVREPDYDVVFKRVKAGNLGIDAATDVKQNVLLTGSSADVRRWMMTALKDETLWANWTTFTRSTR